MIPAREQIFLRDFFAEQLTGPVKLTLFTQRPVPVFIPGREECTHCPDVQAILTDIAGLSPKISLQIHERAEARPAAERLGIQRIPATVIRGVLNRPIVFYGLPAGEQFTVLINLFIAVSSGDTGAAPAIKKKLKRLKQDVTVEVFVTPDSAESGEAVRAATVLASESAHVRLSVTELSGYPALAQELDIQAVPLTIIDGRGRLSGVPAEADLATEVIRVAELPKPRTRAGAVRVASLLELPGSAQPRAGEARPSGLIIPGR